jgi:hypothetical protein
MGFDDLLKDELQEKTRRDHERRQLLMALPARADEARDSAQAAVVSALTTMQGLGRPGFVSTGLPAPIVDDAVERSFAVTVRTDSGQIEFMVTGVVECRLENGRLVYAHRPLRLQATGFDFMQPRTRETTFTGIRAGVDEPSFSVDAGKLEAAMRDLVKRLAT